MLRFTFYSLLLLAAGLLIGLGAVLWYVLPQLPAAAELSEVHLQTPLRVFTEDGKLIAEFGEKRRQPSSIDEIPDLMKQAFIAAEDDRFYEHPGVDWMAIARAAVELAQTREKRQGGSTITMQVARNFFLTPEKTYERKLKEIVLAIKIERELSKDKILELYLNKIFLGHRSYGVGAAAQVYYGKQLDELSVAEIAMIAGLPKAPSATNPISNPAAALTRRAYVLSRMHKLGFIDDAAYATANAQPITASIHGLTTDVSAEYIAEMVRAYMQEHYPEDSSTAGFRVYTTVNSRLQEAANAALRKTLIDFSRRHGYRGPENQVDLTELDDEQRAALLDGYLDIGGLIAGLVVEVGENNALVMMRRGPTVTLPWQGIKWARKYLSQNAVAAWPKEASDVLAVGDIVRVEWQAPLAEEAIKSDSTEAEKAGYWRLAQIPQVEGALVSLDSHNGAIQSLVGGFDFYKSKFNRVTQAQRQPGSNFKPFVYSAALEHGFTAASFINDAPIVFEAPGLEAAWRPENYSGKYFGPTRLRVALTKSRNLVSIRLLKAIGIDNAVEHAAKFGIDTSRIPRNLSLSLGSGEITPLEVATAYAVFSNGGFRIEPYFIERIADKNDETIWEARPLEVCPACERAAQLDQDELLSDEPADIAAAIKAQQAAASNVAPRTLSADNAWIISSILRDVITSGTGRRARVLERTDLSGKTGTTNDQKDAWFSGFNAKTVTTVWVGFDNSKPLGRRETGAHAALPMWIDYMRVALEGTPPAVMEQPPGLVTVRIDPSTGMLAGINNPNAIFESFREGQVPKRASSFPTPERQNSGGPEVEQLF